MARTIGLLTGTFDPIHLGHVALAKEAMRAAGLDEVWLLVNAAPAHKAEVSSYARRLEMAELAVADEPGLRVAGAGVPHTLAGFWSLVIEHPDTTFVFIVGMDTLAWLDTWDDYEAVVRSQSFVVARRPGVPEGRLQDLRQRLGALGEELQVQVFGFDDYSQASSKATREATRRGERPSDLHNEVYEYIVRFDLYR